MGLDLKTPQESRQDSVAPEVDGLQAGVQRGQRAVPDTRVKDRGSAYGPARGQFMSTGHPADQSASFRSRKALLMTDTELKVMAALAIIGLSRIPSTGYSAPAARGIPSAL